MARHMFDPTLLCSLSCQSREKQGRNNAGLFGMDLCNSQNKASRSSAKHLQAPGRYESVLGGLSFSPASLRFDASFPGQVPEIELEKTGHVKLKVLTDFIYWFYIFTTATEFLVCSFHLLSLLFDLFGQKHWSGSMHPGFWVATFQFFEVQSRVVAARSTFEQPLQLNAGRTWQDNWDQRRCEESFMHRNFVHVGSCWPMLAMYTAQNASILGEGMNADMDVCWAYDLWPMI